MKMQSRRVILLVLVLLGIALCAMSQQSEALPERTAEQEALKLTEVMQRQLNLTAEQTNAVFDINLKYAQKRREPHDKAEAMKNRQAKNQELKNVLTAKQYDIFMQQRGARQYMTRQTIVVAPLSNP